MRGQGIYRAKPRVALEYDRDAHSLGIRFDQCTPTAKLRTCCLSRLLSVAFSSPLLICLARPHHATTSIPTQSRSKCKPLLVN
jgi:hypothetical protein